ncbi:MAG: carboxynorspermidine decarboxylase [Sulfurovum sp.]|nr:carboxynorspermidine decarboxylase [Sulfurovaceae bacterium]
MKNKSEIENIKNIPSPTWILEEKLLQNNLNIFQDIQDKSDAKILLALKGYSLWASFPQISQTLKGCCASGLWEAQLAYNEFQKEVHTYSPAFKDKDIEEIARISDHIVFNSINQFKKFSNKALNINPNISLGIRINPEYSSSPVEIYNPCSIFSRLGITIKNFDDTILNICEGFHFHALCEESAESLESVLSVFEDNFEKYLYNLKWINFGGGHHITKDGYNIDKLISLILRFKDKYNVDIYLELGEAVGWESGSLVATVLDIIDNGIKIAILDISAEAHLLDTIIMPYRAKVRGACKAYKKNYTYRLAGNSCLAGDIMGDYSFDNPLDIGDMVIFEDQIHYTMVKATTFNGISLPSISILDQYGNLKVIREFQYQDFKDRLS